MTQQEFVTKCKDCIFNYWSVDNNIYCNHPEHRGKALKEEEQDKIPNLCPLKEGPITIQLSKFL